MRWMVISLIVVLSAIVLLGVLTFRDSAGTLPGTGPSKGRVAGAIRLQAMSPHPETVQSEFERVFSQWHQETHGAPVEIVWGDVGGGASSIFRYVESSFQNAPAGIGIDFVWGGGFVPYQKLAESGLLVTCEMPETILDAMVLEIGGVATHDPQFRWYGSALSGFGIIFNRQRLARRGIPEPQTWADMASADMFGEVGAADPRKSGSAYMAYEIILQALGWERGWGVLTRMAANSRNFYLGASDVPKDISLGEISAGPAIDFYAWAQIREDGPERIGYTLPRSMTVINPDSIGVLKGAPNMEVAKRFVRFVLSKEGQRLWVLKQGAEGGPVQDELNRIPIRMDVYEEHKKDSNVRFDPDLLKSDFRFDSAAFANRQLALQDLYGAALIDAHPELVAAWKAIVGRGARPEEVQRLCAPPLTNEALSEMSTQRWQDENFRNRKIAEWTNEARRRYRALAQGG